MTAVAAEKSVFQNGPFMRFMAGNAVSLTGTWMQRVLIAWLVWDMTASGTWLGLVAAADLLPTLALAPFAGAMADRYKRLNIARVTEALGMVQALTLTLAYGFGMLTVEGLLVLTLIHGVIMAINQPARHALLYSLVSKADVGPAVAINSVVFNVARLVGPVLAGAAIGSIGIGWGFGFNAVSFSVFFFALMSITIAGEARARSPVSFLTQTREGIGYTSRHRGIASVLLIVLAMGLGVKPVFDLLAGYADAVLEAGASGFVILTSGVAVGGILGATFMARRSSKPISTIVISSGVSLAISMLIFVFMDDFYVALFVFVAVGFYQSRLATAGQIYIQMAAAEDMRGRVMSLHGMIQRGGPALGALVVGAASDLLGFRWPLVAGALLLIACTGFVFWRRFLDQPTARSTAR